MGWGLAHYKIWGKHAAGIALIDISMGKVFMLCDYAFFSLPVPWRDTPSYGLHFARLMEFITF